MYVGKSYFKFQQIKNTINDQKLVRMFCYDKMLLANENISA